MKKFLILILLVCGCTPEEKITREKPLQIGDIVILKSGYASNKVRMTVEFIDGDEVSVVFIWGTPAVEQPTTHREKFNIKMLKRLSF